MPKHRNVLYPAMGRDAFLRGDYPLAYVQTAQSPEGEHLIEMSFFHAEGEPGVAIKVNRHMAMMLARRIKQCLEESK